MWNNVEGSMAVSSFRNSVRNVYSASPREISRLEHQNSVSKGYIAEQFTMSSG